MCFTVRVLDDGEASTKWNGLIALPAAEVEGLSGEIAQMSDTKFWLIWSPQGATFPTVKHQTKQTADAEAVRLASLNPGQEFYVLTAESLTIRRDVHVIQLRGASGQTDNFSGISGGVTNVLVSDARAGKAPF